MRTILGSLVGSGAAVAALALVLGLEGFPGSVLVRWVVPVGFLGGDPEKQGRTLLGLAVLGPLAAAKGIAEKTGLTDVFIAHSPEDRFDPEQVAHWLEAQDLSPHTISVSIDDLTR